MGSKTPTPAKSSEATPSATPPKPPASPEIRKTAHVSLFQFLSKRGGLQPHPDLKSILDTRTFQLVRNNGMSLDIARRACVEANYLPDTPFHLGPSTSSTNDLLDAIEREARGNKVYPFDDPPPATDLEDRYGPEDPDSLIVDLTTDDLPRLATEANDAHKKVIQTATESVMHAVAAGKALNSARKVVRHGKWGTWQTDNLNFCVSTVSLYRRTADWFETASPEDLQRVASLSLRRMATALVTRKRKPKVKPAAALEIQPRQPSMTAEIQERPTPIMVATVSDAEGKPIDAELVPTSPADPAPDTLAHISDDELEAEIARRNINRLAGWIERFTNKYVEEHQRYALGGRLMIARVVVPAE